MSETLGNVLSGFTSCPACRVLGRPQEERMAFPGDDARVTCISCNRTTSEIPHDLVAPLMELPAPIKDALLAVTSWNWDSVPKQSSPVERAGVYRVFAVDTRGLGFSADYDEHDANRAAGAVACGNADVVLEEAERVTIKAALVTEPTYRRTNDMVEITYVPGDLDKLDTRSYRAEPTDRPLMDRLTGPRAKAVSDLLAIGFRLVHHDLESSMPRILLVNNRDGVNHSGVRAEIKWMHSS